MSEPTDDYCDDGHDDTCAHCGGEGFVANCWEEYACIDPEGGCDACLQPCDWCNPYRMIRPPPALTQDHAPVRGREDSVFGQTSSSTQCADEGTLSPRSPPAATTQASPATCYTVRNGWAWAHIFVRHGVRQDERGPCTWAHIAVLSDYGEFGHCWTYIGGGSWQAFLAELDFSYAMQKFMGPRFKVPLSASEAAEKARTLVLDQRRQGALTKADALELWDAIEWASEDGTADDFLREWDRHSSGAMYRNEMYDARWDQPNPQAVGFWREVWPHFIEAIRPALSTDARGPHIAVGDRAAQVEVKASGRNPKTPTEMEARKNR